MTEFQKLMRKVFATKNQKGSKAANFTQSTCKQRTPFSHSAMRMEYEDELEAKILKHAKLSEFKRAKAVRSSQALIKCRAATAQSIVSRV